MASKKFALGLVDLVPGEGADSFAGRHHRSSMHEALVIASIAVALAADAFAVSLGMAMRSPTAKTNAIWVGIVGFLHASMPWIGAQISAKVLATVEVLATWGAPLVLVIIALNMIREVRSSAPSPSPSPSLSPSEKGRQQQGVGVLLGLGLATSVDALGVGFSLPVLVESPGLAIAAISGVAGFAALFGVVFGQYLSATFGAKIEIVGAFILVGVAIHMVTPSFNTLF